MALTPSQRAVLATIKQVAAEKRASPKQIKAAIETAIVESNISNPSGGDADSAGWRQERASLYENPTDVKASAARFFDETAAVKDKYGRAGDLAAAVQRPAAQYRGRYQQQSGRADQLMGARSPGGAGGQGSSASTRTTSRTVGAVDNSAARSAAISQFLNDKNSDPLSFAMQVRGLQDTPGTKVTTTTRTAGAASGSSKSPQSSAVTKFGGKEVAAWMVPALKYAKAHGWTGTITSGVRTRAEQAALYANRASNPNPVAKPGTSNHEVGSGGGGAVDVSDPNGLAKALAGFRGRKLKQGTAIGDPVHFSASGR